MRKNKSPNAGNIFAKICGQCHKIWSKNEKLCSSCSCNKLIKIEINEHTYCALLGHLMPSPDNVKECGRSSNSTMIEFTCVRCGQSMSMSYK